ncbi:MAG TPA: hypothetical protein DFR83_25795, partial [Deltaproteobacteria bacterium]|nr:hypothetical protein [Deltaproteobacteria bacterium]
MAGPRHPSTPEDRLDSPRYPLTGPSLGPFATSPHAAPLMKSTFCPLPWLHALVEPNGATKLCCISSYARFNDGQLRTVYQEPLADIFNGDYFRKVRERMVSGQRVHECSGCNKAEQSGVESRRQRLVEKWQEGAYGPPPASF